jgi:hypothetical protein
VSEVPVDYEYQKTLKLGRADYKDYSAYYYHYSISLDHIVYSIATSFPYTLPTQRRLRTPRTRSDTCITQSSHTHPLYRQRPPLTEALLPRLPPVTLPRAYFRSLYQAELASLPIRCQRSDSSDLPTSSDTLWETHPRMRTVPPKAPAMRHRPVTPPRLMFPPPARPPLSLLEPVRPPYDPPILPHSIPA